MICKKDIIADSLRTLVSAIHRDCHGVHGAGDRGYEGENVDNFLEKSVHKPECTWLLYVNAGEKPPGQSFWGKLNYLWCQEFCQRHKVEYEVEIQKLAKTLVDTLSDEEKKRDE